MRTQPEIADRLVLLESMIEKYKSAQPIDGRGIVGWRHFDTSTLYDYTFTITEDNTRRSITVPVLNAKGRVMMARLRVWARVDNPDVMANPLPPKTPTAPPVTIKCTRTLWTPEKTEFRIDIIKNLPGFYSFQVYLKWVIVGTSVHL